jgi:hypothetical protein
MQVNGVEMRRYFCIKAKTSGEGDISIAEIYSETEPENRDFAWGFYEFYTDYEIARRRARGIKEELQIKAVV